MANEVYSFGLTDFRVVSSNFRLKTDKEYDLSKILDIELSLTIGYHLESGTNDLKLTMKVEIAGDEMPFSLAIESWSSFLFNEKVEDGKALEQVAKINCASIVFPYLREVVADTVRRGGLPPLHLPPMNFVELYFEKHPERMPTPQVEAKAAGAQRPAKNKKKLA